MSGIWMAFKTQENCNTSHFCN